LPFNPYTGAPIYNVDAYLEAERREEAAARAVYHGPVGEREELAKARDNLVGLRAALTAAEEAMSALGRFDTKVEGVNLEGEAGLRRMVRRHWVDAVYSVELTGATIRNLERSIKSATFSFYRRPVVWR
jgi:hypothetical protein